MDVGHEQSWTLNSYHELSKTIHEVIMTNLQTFDKHVLTMTSRDIAELVESRHDSVRLSIERLAERGVIQLPSLVEV